MIGALDSTRLGQGIKAHGFSCTTAKYVCSLVLGVLANIPEHNRREIKNITVYIKHETPSNAIKNEHVHCAICKLGLNSHANYRRITFVINKPIFMS